MPVMIVNLPLTFYPRTGIISMPVPINSLKLAPSFSLVLQNKLRTTHQPHQSQLLQDLLCGFPGSSIPA